MRVMFGFYSAVVFLYRHIPMVEDMDIRWRSVDGVAMLDLKGRLLISPGEIEVRPLRAAITELIVDGCLDVGFNLSGLTHIDARGLGELVVARETVRRHGGHLTLVSPSSRVARILAVTRLDTVFDCCDSETDFTTATSRTAQGRHAASVVTASAHLEEARLNAGSAPG